MVSSRGLSRIEAGTLCRLACRLRRSDLRGVRLAIHGRGRDRSARWQLVGGDGDGLDGDGRHAVRLLRRSSLLRRQIYGLEFLAGFPFVQHACRSGGSTHGLRLRQHAHRTLGPGDRRRWGRSSHGSS